MYMKIYYKKNILKLINIKIVMVLGLIYIYIRLFLKRLFTNNVIKIEYSPLVINLYFFSNVLFKNI